jgi:hypothetical protein
LALEINKFFVVEGLRKLLTQNVVIKKSTFEFFIVKNFNDTILEFDLIPDKVLNIRQKPTESFGSSDETFYLTSGSLETRISLNHSEAKEKRISLPMPSISKTQALLYPDEFEKASIKDSYDQERYSFLIKNHDFPITQKNKENKDEPFMTSSITPVFLYDGVYYTGSEVYLDCYQSKPKTKASVKKIKFDKMDQINREKVKAIKNLRSIDEEDEEGVNI